jgi:hypothetical protein
MNRLGTLPVTRPDDARLFILYRPPQNKLALCLLAVLAPLWAIYLPFLTLSLLLSGWQPEKALLMIASAVVTALGVLATTLFLDNKIELTPDVVKLPLSFFFACPALKRNWSTLRQMKLQDETGDPNCAASLVFVFDDSSHFSLSLFGLDKLNFELLVRYVQKYASHIEIDVKDLGSDLNLNESRVLRSNYTQIWQSGLTNKFNATAFVPLEIGAVLSDGRIKIKEQLSFGGLSAVYGAVANGHEIVVKELAIAPSEDPGYLKAKELFVREAELLMNIEHPRIAKLRDFIVENNRHYLLLDRLEGVDLRQHLTACGAIKEETALAWSAQVAETLSFMHECVPAVVHRDISPDNLILGSDGSISIIDFGAATQFLSSATGTIVGKQAYVSPEQFRGKAVPASDLYSLSATLFFLLTGKDPEPLTPASAPESVSEGTRQLVLSGMALNIDERPASAKEFARQARALITHIADGDVILCKQN